MELVLPDRCTCAREDGNHDYAGTEREASIIAYAAHVVDLDIDAAGEVCVLLAAGFHVEGT